MTFLILFLEFLKIGLFTFGGGYAMIPFIKETVLKYNWMSEAQFLDMIGVSEVTPGPIAINMATYIGSTQGYIELGYFGSFLGSLIATIAVILPAFIIMLLIAIVLKRVIKNKYVQGALKGIRSVAVALIFGSGLTLLADVLFPVSLYDNVINVTFNKTPIFIFFLIIFAYFVVNKICKKKVPPYLVILSSALLGIVVGYITNLSF